MDLEKKIAELKIQRSKLSQEQQQMLERDFVAKMIYHSNALEGNPMTLDQVKEVLDEQN